VAPPFKLAEFDIEYGVGISREGCLLDLALEHDLAQKSGSFFSYGETRLGQGRNNSKEFLRQNPEMAAEIETQIYAKLEAEKPEVEETPLRSVAAVEEPPAEEPAAKPKPPAKPEPAAKPAESKAPEKAEPKKQPAKKAA
jgi:recombination protein RecA